MNTCSHIMLRHNFSLLQDLTLWCYEIMSSIILLSWLNLAYVSYDSYKVVVRLNLRSYLILVYKSWQENLEYSLLGIEFYKILARLT